MTTRAERATRDLRYSAINQSLLSGRCRPCSLGCAPSAIITTASGVRCDRASSHVRRSTSTALSCAITRVHDKAASRTPAAQVRVPRDPELTSEAEAEVDLRGTRWAAVDYSGQDEERGRDATIARRVCRARTGKVRLRWR